MVSFVLYDSYSEEKKIPLESAKVTDTSTVYDGTGQPQRFRGQNHCLGLNMKEGPGRNEIPMGPKQRLTEIRNFIGQDNKNSLCASSTVRGVTPSMLRDSPDTSSQHLALCLSCELPPGGRVGLSPPEHSTGLSSWSSALRRRSVHNFLI